MRSALDRARTACAAMLAAGFIAALLAPAADADATVTLGSVSGTPGGNICSPGFVCTYVPFTGVSNPSLKVPFDGTVTGFALNSGSATGNVELRILRPAGGGQFTGVGTSPAQALAGGINTYTASLPVKAGDVLALDNDSDALIFDTSDATPLTAYYQPALANGQQGLPDGQTAAPNNTRSGYRLLLAAVVTEAPPHATKITKSKIKGKKHKASFSFSASGGVTGFQCKLLKAHKKAHASFTACSSPKTYKHLASGRYTFKVRALNPAGPDPSPASRTFTVR